MVHFRATTLVQYKSSVSISSVIISMEFCRQSRHIWAEQGSGVMLTCVLSQQNQRDQYSHREFNSQDTLPLFRTVTGPIFRASFPLSQSRGTSKNNVRAILIIGYQRIPYFTIMPPLWNMSLAGFYWRITRNHYQNYHSRIEVVFFSSL